MQVQDREVDQAYFRATHQGTVARSAAVQARPPFRRRDQASSERACQASDVSGYEVVRVLVVGGALIVGFGALMLLGLLTMIRALFCESLFETP